MKPEEFMIIPLPPDKKVYFASDFHLGVPDKLRSREREQLVVAWLDQVSADAAHIFLVGDIFDFWFEYKDVVPRGYVRLLGKLAELRDRGIPVSVFIGNHDMWMKGYFEEELDIPVYYEPKIYQIGKHRFYIGHGDGLGPGDHGYKFIKKVFRNPLCRWLFASLHPRWGIGMANFWSRKSRGSKGEEDREFLGKDQEWLAIYSREILEKEHFDFFIFGHRHIPMDIRLNDHSRYLNLGDWIYNFTYAVYDGEDTKIHRWLDNQATIHSS